MEVAIAQRAGDRGAGVRVPGRVRLHALADHRPAPGATTAVRCVDVAALVAAAIVRRNPAAEVLPFESTWCALDSLVARQRDDQCGAPGGGGGGGTCVSAPLAQLNARKAKGDLVVFVSDNESWMDASGVQGHGDDAGVERVPRAQPAGPAGADRHPAVRDTQAAEREDILNIGGFSDRVFEVIAEFATGRCRRPLGRPDRRGRRSERVGAGPECLRDYIQSRCLTVSPNVLVRPSS